MKHETGRAGLMRYTLEVPCTVDIAQTPELLHAHVVLDGIDIGPGDAVLVHDAPTRVAYGEHIVCDRQATIVRAGWLGRLWTRVTARFELGVLYEVSFSPDRLNAPAIGRRNP
jgi:F420-0:gamma-glutamyl ligase-like protein